MNTSFSLINLRKIVSEFFANDEIKYDNDYIISFLNPKERKIIDRIKKGGFKRITIHFDKGSRPIKFEGVSEEKIQESTIGQVARLMKKGEYSTIKISQQDGNLVSFEKSELVKL